MAGSAAGVPALCTVPSLADSKDLSFPCPSLQGEQPLPEPGPDAAEDKKLKSQGLKETDLNKCAAERTLDSQVKELDDVQDKPRAWRSRWVALL